MICGVLAAVPTVKIWGPGLVAVLAAAAASPVADPAVMVAAFAGIGAVATAWVNNRASRNRAELQQLRGDMFDARDRADRAAELVHKLDRQLHDVQVQLTHYQIGTLRLIDQLIELSVDPVWHPHPEQT